MFEGRSDNVLLVLRGDDKADGGKAHGVSQTSEAEGPSEGRFRMGPPEGEDEEVVAGPRPQKEEGH